MFSFADQTPKPSESTAFQGRGRPRHLREVKQCHIVKTSLLRKPFLTFENYLVVYTQQTFSEV
jgi:hypothetical protein